MRNRESTRAIVVAAAFLVLAAPGCGGEASDEGRHFVVTANEYRFEPDELEVPAGVPVRIEFHNDGDMPHNLTFEGIGQGTPTLEPGQRAELLIELETPGRYAFECTVTNHAGMGLRGHLVVDPTSADPETGRASADETDPGSSPLRAARTGDSPLR
jgi:plastocyanin